MSVIDTHYPRSWQRWSVAVLGVLVGAFTVLHAFVDRNSLAGLIQELTLPFAISVLLVLFGVRLARSDLDSEYFPRILLWVGVGVAAFGFLGTWLFVHRVLMEGTALNEGIHELVTDFGSGALAGFGIGIYDVRRQQREDELKLANTALESTMDGIAILDRDDQYVFVNQSYADIHRCDDPAQLLGEQWRYLSSAANRERFEEEIRPVLAETGAWRGEAVIHRSDGRTVPEELTITELEDGGRVYVVRDVTERKERERELEASEARFRSLTENTQFSVVTIDEGSTIRFANDAVEDTFGYASDEVVGDSLTTLMPDRFEASHLEGIERYLREGEPHLDWEWTELVGLHEDGHEFPIGVSFGTYAVDGEHLFTGVIHDITERKEYEQALERSEDLLDKTQRMADVGGWEYDVRRDEMRGTDEAYRIFELPLDTELGLENVLDLFYPEDRLALEDALERAIERGESYELELRAIMANDDLRWMNVRGTPIQRGSQTVLLRGAVQDITERKKREQELQSTKDTLSTLLANIPAGVLAEDGSREILFANEAFCDLFDVRASPEDLVGADCVAAAERVKELFVDRERFVEGNDTYVAEGTTVHREEFELTGGRTIERSGTPIPVDEGEGHYLWVYHDVSDYKRTEETLRALHDATREMMVAETRREVATIASETADDVIGLSLNALYRHETGAGLVPVAVSSEAQSVVGESPRIAPGDGIAWQVFETGEVQIYSDVREAPNVLNLATPIRTELTLPLGDHGVFILGSTTIDDFDAVDVALAKVLAANTEAALDRVEHEVQLRAQREDLSRQNDRLEEFASVVSHDLRNPLTIAMGYLDLIETADEDPLDKIRNAHDRMETIIEDVLTLARQGKSVGETERVSIADVAETAWNHVETHDARLVIEDDPGTVDADEGRLEALFENLFRNAIEHVGEDVTVEIGSTAEGFYVADDGPGIPADAHEQVFEHGHTTSESGTGFGLSIVKSIAEAHGWAVALADPDTGIGGARFVIRCHRPLAGILTSYQA